VVCAWPENNGRGHVEFVLSGLAGDDGCFGLKEFTSVVRLWYLTGGNILTFRSFLIRSSLASSLSLLSGLLAAQVTVLVMKAARGPVPWGPLMTAGGIGAGLGTLLFDAHGVRPTSHSLRASRPSASLRGALLVSSNVLVGVTLSPLVPLVSGTVGDPKSLGFGPLALAALGVVHTVGETSTLAMLPDTEPHSLVGASLVGGVLAASLGFGVAHLADRQSAVRPLMAGIVLVSLQAAYLSLWANWSYTHGDADPLSPAMASRLAVVRLVRRLLG